MYRIFVPRPLLWSDATLVADLFISPVTTLFFARRIPTLVSILLILTPLRPFPSNTNFTSVPINRTLLAVYVSSSLLLYLKLCMTAAQVFPPESIDTAKIVWKHCAPCNPYDVGGGGGWKPRVGKKTEKSFMNKDGMKASCRKSSRLSHRLPPQRLNRDVSTGREHRRHPST